MKSMWKVLAMVFAMVPALATADISIQDTDGDGAYSVEEVTTAYPDVTEDMFAEMDTNEDGALDPEEWAAAIAAGMIRS